MEGRPGVSEDERTTTEVNSSETAAPAKPRLSWVIRWGIPLLVLLHLGLFGVLLVNKEEGGGTGGQIPTSTPLAEIGTTPSKTAEAILIPLTPTVALPTPTVVPPSPAVIPATPTGILPTPAVLPPTPTVVPPARTPVQPTATATSTPAATSSPAVAASDFRVWLNVEDPPQFAWYTVVFTITNSGPVAANSITIVIQGDLFDRYDLLSFGPGLADDHQEQDGRHFDFGPLPAGTTREYRLNILPRGHPVGHWTASIYYNQTHLIQKIGYTSVAAITPEKEDRAWVSRET